MIDIEVKRAYHVDGDIHQIKIWRSIVMKKKTISVVLAVCLLVLCVPLASVAEEAPPELTEAADI